jgi:hypothetical protein
VEAPARRPRLWQLVPHPSRPGSMVAFAALPAFLILLTLVWVVASLYPVRPLLPAAFTTRGPSPEEESARLRQLAEGLASGTPDERRLKMLTLAGETERCPGYAPFTVPQLAARLKDPDARVRAATAFALGALGPPAAEALRPCARRKKRGTLNSTTLCRRRFGGSSMETRFHRPQSAPRYPPLSPRRYSESAGAG